MNRRSPKYGKGVFQRCDATCPPQGKVCKKHTWAYHAELPTGPSGKRRRWTKGGFPSAKAAADARAEILAAEQAGILPTDGKQTVGVWLTEWIDGKVGAESIRATTEAGYRGHIDNYLIPYLGNLRLIDLRPHHVTKMLIEIRREHDKRIAEAKRSTTRSRPGEGATQSEFRSRDHSAQPPHNASGRRSGAPSTPPSAPARSPGTSPP